MWEEIFDGLNSPDDHEKRTTWHTLRQAIHGGNANPQQQHLQQLLERLDNEETFDTWKLGVNVLLSHLVQGTGPHATPVSAGVPQQGGLAQWFWDLFRRPTIVLRIYDHLRRRDEDAVTELARLLPFHEFRQTRFIRVPTENPPWDQLLRHEEDGLHRRPDRNLWGGFGRIVRHKVDAILLSHANQAGQHQARQD